MEDKKYYEALKSVLSLNYFFHPKIPVFILGEGLGIKKHRSMQYAAIVETAKKNLEIMSQNLELEEENGKNFLNYLGGFLEKGGNLKLLLGTIPRNSPTYEIIRKARIEGNQNIDVRVSDQFNTEYPFYNIMGDKKNNLLYVGMYKKGLKKLEDKEFKLKAFHHEKILNWINVDKVLKRTSNLKDNMSLAKCDKYLFELGIAAMVNYFQENLCYDKENKTVSVKKDMGFSMLSRDSRFSKRRKAFKYLFNQSPKVSFD